MTDHHEDAIEIDCRDQEQDQRKYQGRSWRVVGVQIASFEQLFSNALSLEKGIVDNHTQSANSVRQVQHSPLDPLAY